MSSDHEMRIAIVDDQDQDRLFVMELTEQILHRALVAHTISCYNSGKALLEEIHGGKKIDLILLDMVMDEMDGMELAAELRKHGNKTAIIFISSNLELALYGYEVSAVRYLLKPVNAQKLEEALMYCCTLMHAKKEILLPTDRGQYRTSLSDIQYVEAFDRGTRFHLPGETVECRMKFGDVESWLPKSAFLPCHRAFIVNLSHVKSIRNYEFTLNGGHRVPISKNRYTEIYKRFVEYIAD